MILFLFRISKLRKYFNLFGEIMKQHKESFRNGLDICLPM